MAIVAIGCGGDAGSDDGRLCERVDGVCGYVDEQNERAAFNDLGWAVDCEYDRDVEPKVIRHVCDPEPAQDRCYWKAMENRTRDLSYREYEVLAYCHCAPDEELEAYKAKECPDE